MSKAKELQEKIHDLGVEIATLAVREYVGEAEDYIAEFDSLIEQILQTYENAGIVQKGVRWLK
ncbi:hypothetical protein KA005_46845 [bacterium]|nr:hypothetical protein [bacterium]